MPKRVFLPLVQPGTITLPPDQAHHVRDVLRLASGEIVEVFDASGTSGAARLSQVTPQSVTAEVESIRPPDNAAAAMTLAVAFPKGPRADWMIEKLSELGVARLIPLQTERSISQAAGQSKTDRWLRIAVESAKQSRRTGVMTIAPPIALADLVASWQNSPDQAPATWLLSTEPGAESAARALQSGPPPSLLLIGPEGGWTQDELNLLNQSAIQRVRLLQSILRVETAAIAAAASVLSMGDWSDPRIPAKSS
jgi:16S rRNA (uracil1498-N3)-methyltransferase